MERNPVVRQRQLAERLRKLRETAGRTLDDAAKHLDCSVAKISRIETARVAVRVPDVRSLLDFYSVDSGDRAEIFEMLEQSKQAPWWQEYSDVFTVGAPMTFLALEDDAEKLRWYEQAVVPGLLQERSYGYASVAPTKFPDHQIDRLVELRCLRQRVLTKTPPLKLHTVLDEAVLHRLVGGPAVMHAQLLHLIEAANLPSVTLQILPFSAGLTAAFVPFAIFSFADPTMSEVGFSEGLHEERYEHRPERIADYSRAFDDLVAYALNTAESIELMKSLAEKLL